MWGDLKKKNDLMPISHPRQIESKLQGVTEVFVFCFEVPSTDSPAWSYNGATP